MRKIAIWRCIWLRIVLFGRQSVYGRIVSKKIFNIFKKMYKFTNNHFLKFKNKIKFMNGQNE